MLLFEETLTVKKEELDCEKDNEETRRENSSQESI